jgi:hypothetical protein
MPVPEPGLSMREMPTGALAGGLAGGLQSMTDPDAFGAACGSTLVSPLEVGLGTLRLPSLLAAVRIRV